jgi:hypothetical protein
MGDAMKTSSKLERVIASIAASAITLSVVWTIAGYAYPQAPSPFGQLAKASVQSRS